MEKDDPTFYPEVSSEEESHVQQLDKHEDEVYGDAEPVEKGSRQAKRRAAESLRTVRPKIKRKQSEDELLGEMEVIRKLRGAGTLDQQSTCLLLHTYFALKLDALRQSKKSGRHKKIIYKDETAKLLGCSSRTVGDALARWNAGTRSSDTVPTAGARGRHGPRVTRVPMTRQALTSTREFVREKRIGQERVTATQVLDFLIERKIVDVRQGPLGIHDRKDYDAALRATQRFLQRAGYQRGKKENVTLSHKMCQRRDQYLKDLMAYRSLPVEQRLREVYLDENYIHQHYHRLDDSIFDPNDDQDLLQTVRHKGRRWCFLLAIEGPDPRLSDPSSEQEGNASHNNSSRIHSRHLAGIVPGSEWIFDPSSTVSVAKRRRARKTVGGRKNVELTSDQLTAVTLPNPTSSCDMTQASLVTADEELSDMVPMEHKGDYHKNFNQHNFLHWWIHQLLPNLSGPSLIVLDNAPYHKCKAATIPEPIGMTKAELISALRERGIECHEGEYVSALRSRLREWIEHNVKPEIVELAEAQGHRVLFTPPGFPDFQPIETLWAHLKGSVGRQYNNTTSFQDVRQRLQREIEALHGDTGQYRRDKKTRIQAMIDASDHIVKKEHEMALQTEGTETQDAHDDQDTFPNNTSVFDVEQIIEEIDDIGILL